MIAGGVGSRIHPADWVRQVMRGACRGGEKLPERRRGLFDALRDGAGQRRRGRRGDSSKRATCPGPRRADPRPAFSVAARPSSRTAGVAGTADGTSTLGRGSTAIRRAIVAALRDAGRTPADVGFVVAHGLSTLEDDRLEAQAIRETLGDVPVTAPKSYFGYLGAAAGSLEMVLSVLALQHGQVPPSLNYQQSDPQCPINVIHGRPMSLDRPVALILSHSAHGQAVAVILGGAE